MGMAASQGRFLQLTGRKHDIGCMLTRLSNDKVSLSREMQKISSNYQEALNTKTLKWSNNAGVSYVDLSYANMMRPSEMNQNVPYMISDNAGRIVLDSQYAKYAEMISPDGKAGGDWESNRSQILAELTGVDASTIEKATEYDIDMYNAQASLDNLEAPSRRKFEKHSTQDLLANVKTSGLSFSPSANNWKEAYNKNSTASIGSGSAAASKLDAVLDNILSSLSKFFDVEEYGSKFEEAINLMKEDYKPILENNSELKSGAITGSSSGYKINTKEFILELWGKYIGKGGEAYTSAYSGVSEASIIWYDTTSDAYKTWTAEQKEYENQTELYKNDYNDASNAKGLLMTAEQERLVKFYDELFSTIAENGWVENSQVSDTEYLNGMLQNNIYSITTVERDFDFNEKKQEFSWENTYSTNIASNFSKVYTVNDSDAQNDALVEYEYQKSIINAKETRIDTRMKDLETEQSAIQQMLQGLETVRNDNIERNFSIFS